MKRLLLLLLVLAGCVLLSWRRTGADGAVQLAYGVGYEPHLDYLKQQLAELRAIRALLEVSRPGGPAAKSSASALITARCASCHADGKAEERGDGFVLVEADGKLASLSVGDRRRVKRKLVQKAMPPGAPLPEAESKAILDWIDSLGKERK